MPTIMGPKMTAKGHNVTLICNASSNPPSTYKWVFNDSVVAYTSVYITPPFTSDMSGKYTCMANNNITGKTNTAYTMLTALGETWMAPFCFSVNVFLLPREKMYEERNYITGLNDCFCFQIQQQTCK